MWLIIQPSTMSGNWSTDSFVNCFKLKPVQPLVIDPVTLWVYLQESSFLFSWSWALIGEEMTHDSWELSFQDCIRPICSIRMAQDTHGTGKKQGRSLGEKSLWRITEYVGEPCMPKEKRTEWSECRKGIHVKVRGQPWVSSACLLHLAWESISL